MPLSSHAQNPHHGLWLPEPEDWDTCELGAAAGDVWTLLCTQSSVCRCQIIPQNEEIPLALPSKHHSLWDLFVCGFDTRR